MLMTEQESPRQPQTASLTLVVYGHSDESLHVCCAVLCPYALYCRRLQVEVSYQHYVACLYMLHPRLNLYTHLALGRPCTQGAPLRDRLARIWAGVDAESACLALSAVTLALSAAGEAPWACSTTPSRPRMVRVLPVPGGPCT